MGELHVSFLVQSALINVEVWRMSMVIVYSIVIMYSASYLPEEDMKDRPRGGDQPVSGHTRWNITA